MANSDGLQHLAMASNLLAILKKICKVVLVHLSSEAFLTCKAQGIPFLRPTCPCASRPTDVLVARNGLAFGFDMKLKVEEHYLKLVVLRKKG